jgi:hypothetical protein
VAAAIAVAVVDSRAVVEDNRAAAAEAIEDTQFAVAVAEVSAHTSMAAVATLEMTVDLALVDPNLAVTVVGIASDILLF